MVVEPAMNNPTVVVLTDRNDLDNQLFDTFCNCSQLLRQEPKQAIDRKTLRELLSVASGGMVFTTIQKFLPEEKGDSFPQLTDRRNVVVVANEAHRSQYDFIDGFARHMRDALPAASFISFTGTPIERQDANTQAVFGDYIDVYDIQQAVADGATVRIYYESRLAKIKLTEGDKAVMDQQVEEITEDDELTDKQKRFAKWASKEAVVGSTQRLQQVAAFDETKRKRTNREIETALRQIVNDAVLSEEVIDVYDAAGIKKPDISILDDKFLAEIKGLPQRNLALELLKRLLEDEVKDRSRGNVSQSKKFSELLQQSVKRYQSGLIEAAEVIDELIRLAQKLKEESERGANLNLREDELAFYDALAENPTAETVLGNVTLKAIAHELVESVRKNTFIDWQLKESVQAKMRTLIKRILSKYKYPPNEPARGEYTVSVTTVLNQAELLADAWGG